MLFFRAVQARHLRASWYAFRGAQVPSVIWLKNHNVGSFITESERTSEIRLHEKSQKTGLAELCKIVFYLYSHFWKFFRKYGPERSLQGCLVIPLIGAVAMNSKTRGKCFLSIRCTGRTAGENCLRNSIRIFRPTCMVGLLLSYFVGISDISIS